MINWFANKQIDKEKVIDALYKWNPIFLRDLARIKNGMFLVGRYVKIRVYKILTLYEWRNSKLNYPRTLQLPVTNRCNLDCVMCNIRSKEFKGEITLEDFKKMLRDPIFGEVRSVGLNGGEPFLVQDIVERVEILVETLPKLQYIYIISNGILVDLIKRKLPEIKSVCENANKKLTVSISLDGVGEVHDEVRAMKGAYAKTLETIEMIQNAPQKYCDNFNIICTISKYNVFHLYEIEKEAKRNDWPISYNVATMHERLNNKCKYEAFGVDTDDVAREMACEFFFKKFAETGSETYYALFKYLEKKCPQRICGCNYLKKAITITPEGEICYCATHSEAIGTIYEARSIKEIYFSNETYNEEIRKRYCLQCSHYMSNDIKKGYFPELLKWFTVRHHKYKV